MTCISEFVLLPHVSWIFFYYYFFFFTILSFTVCPCSKVSCLMCVSITWLQENSEVQNKNQKPPHSCSGARTRTHAAPPYCTAQGTPFTLCSATWLPCYHSSVTSTERAWLRPPRVLKVCHWGKGARGAGWTCGAKKKKKKKKKVTWASPLLRTFSSLD